MSRPRFVLTPEARADLLDIWNYIAEDSPENADRVLERLYAAFTHLAETPGMGHHREDLADRRHRFWTVYSYVIAYRDQTRPLQMRPGCALFLRYFDARYRIQDCFQVRGPASRARDRQSKRY